tara:strand:+ start:344 stop:1231 length:888 start_codon:yes stop_codon:yes gene_type:complete
LIVGQIVIGQQQPYYLFFKQNMSVVNPAATGIEGSIIGLNYKTSMIGVEGGPRLQSLIYHSSNNKNISWGLSAQNEKVNIESYGTVTLDFSYKLQVSGRSYLNLGLKGGMFSNNIDINSIDRITQTNNPSLNLVQNYSNPVFGIGAYLKADNYYFALSINNLLDTTRYKMENGVESQAFDSGQIYTSFGINFTLNNQISINPLVMYSTGKNIDNHIMIIAYINVGENYSFGAGLSGNDNTNFQVLFKGLENLDFGAGYDIRSKKSSLNVNNFELFLRYKLKTNPSRNSSWYKSKD